ncbi:MAG TPA: PP2C family serine/threonine-protein phosphatase [Armatimonadota bacterium]|nr:PP2C family serine/threonine-protein phosphatase [Armatimonadota bacterium]
MRIEVAGLSDCGNHRSQNDDYYCIGPFVEQDVLTTFTLDSTSAHFQRYGLLAAVADGMGGYTGGALASKTVLDTFNALYHSEDRTGCTSNEFVECLQRYVTQTNSTLSRLLERSPELANAGTTIAGIAMMPPDILVIFHAGDSRVLRAAAGYVRQLTIDHTPLGSDVAAGRLTEEEAALQPDSSRLTRVLGLVGDTRVDFQSETAWVPNNTFLIGTDGWHGIGRGLPRKAIQEKIRLGGNAETLVTRLLNDAITVDGHDNATLVIVSITDGGTTNG